MCEINTIVVHCSATKPSQNVNAATIKDWHVNGNGWSDIGYHHVIRRDGAIEMGRPESVTGAHAKGANTGSIGICLIGGIDDDGKPDANFTYVQYESLRTLLQSKMKQYGELAVIGHRDVKGVTKACPCFNVNEWWGL